MKDNFKKITFTIFTIICLIFTIFIIPNTEKLNAAENTDSRLIKKVSQSFSKKFCNSIGFGLSKESAMIFSIKENNQAFNKRKEIHDIDKELLSDSIAMEVVEKCGYPINLSGEMGVNEFKSYYLTKDQEYAEMK